VTTTAGRWAAVTASVRGASHERNGKPNQDAVRVVQSKGPTPGLVAAVCDGHGGDRYVRSDVGSRLGVEVACEVARRALDQLVALPDQATLESQLRGPLTETIVQRWRERVLDDVRARPFTDEERSRAKSPLDGDPLISYGCTLLLAVLTPSWVGLLQIGDGDVTVVRGSTVESPVPDDDRLVGGETTSLCLPTAVTDVRVHVVSEPLPDTLILTTDGYANSFADPNWRTHAGIDLRDQIHRTGLDAVETRLPAWLADSASAGGDDVSMALIQRVDAARSAATAPARPAALPVATGGAASGIGRGVLVASLIAVLLIGTGIGWLIGRQSDTTTAAATTTIATTIGATTTTTTLPTSTTAAPPASTDPPTSPPPTPTTAAPVLASGEHAIVFSDGRVLIFDPDQARPGRVLQYSQVIASGEAPGLGDGWTFVDGGLVFRNRPPVPASAVSRTATFVWAVSGDGANLTSYDAETGKQVGGPVTIEGDLTAVGGTGQPDSIPDTTPATPVATDGTPNQAISTTGG
jgi:hypothetical protein